MKYILLRLYALRILRRPIRRVLLSIDGGDFRSKTLREIFKKYHGVEIGMYSYGGCFNPANISPGITIGKYCSFNRTSAIYTFNHEISSVTTHPFIFSPDAGIVKKDRSRLEKVNIGNDVWMGHNSVILPGVENVGDGAVIAAGAVVTKDVPAYAVAAGVPARVVKYRFDDKTIENLLKIRWWDWPEEKVRENCDLFYDVKGFIKKHGNI